MITAEANFDALSGPTHNYAGLAFGNMASQGSRARVSHPREAALQGLAKMKLLAGLGVRQAVLPPQTRPDLGMLRRLGFAGDDAAMIDAAYRADPALLAACYSSSTMWAANAATVSPSADAADGRVHITPANLISQFHRSMETRQTAVVLRAIFKDERYFAHHPPLPCAAQLADEGAANHTRLTAANDYGGAGIEFFVYGRDACDSEPVMNRSPARYPARQTRQASAAIARLHQLDPAGTIFAQQNPAAIDAGVFHNDVIAVGNQNFLLYHEQAYADCGKTIATLREAYSRACGGELLTFSISEAELSLPEAVGSYLFNSQIVTLADGSMSLIAPIECREIAAAQAVIARLLAWGGPVRSVHYSDLRQSMSNGGGPACLRLRIVLREAELRAVHGGVWLTEALFARLTEAIRRHYREELRPDDLRDPKLIEESHAAGEAIARILALGE